MTESLLTADDLAEHFGLTSGRMAIDYARQYGWPRIQVGRKFRWTPEMVEQIERTHTVSPDGVTETSGRTSRSAARSRAS